jgi:hypothetical protein
VGGGGGGKRGRKIGNIAKDMQDRSERSWKIAMIFVAIRMIRLELENET